MNEDVDVLDAVQESWSALEGLLAGHGRMGATLSRLPDDRLVLAGGVDADGEALADAVVIDVDAATATVIELVSPRVGHTATALPMGTVLLIGGETDDGEGLATVEVLRPPP
jgi:N-acetylneuraminic acid mutarotase